MDHRNDDYYSPRGGYRGPSRGGRGGRRGGERGGYRGHLLYYGGGGRGGRSSSRDEWYPSHGENEGYGGSEQERGYPQHEQGYSQHDQGYGSGTNTYSSHHAGSRHGSYTGGYHSRDKGSFSSQVRPSRHNSSLQQSPLVLGHLLAHLLVSQQGSGAPNGSQRKPSSAWVQILQIKDEKLAARIDIRQEELDTLDKKLLDLNQARHQLEAQAKDLELHAGREELNVQLTNEKLEEFTYL